MSRNQPKPKPSSNGASVISPARFGVVWLTATIALVVGSTVEALGVLTYYRSHAHKPLGIFVVVSAGLLAFFIWYAHKHATAAKAYLTPIECALTVAGVTALFSLYAPLREFLVESSKGTTAVFDQVRGRLTSEVEDYARDHCASVVIPPDAVARCEVVQQLRQVAARGISPRAFLEQLGRVGVGPSENLATSTAPIGRAYQKYDTIERATLPKALADYDTILTETQLTLRLARIAVKDASAVPEKSPLQDSLLLAVLAACVSINAWLGKVPLSIAKYYG